MRNTAKNLFLLVAICFQVSQMPGQTTYSKEVEEQINLFENNLTGRVKINGQGYNILERMAFLKIKGLSIAVVDNYKVVWAKGYGWADEKEKRPVTTSTLFEPGSISKSLNAVGILKLVQDKKLDMDTDINTYLKSWKFPYDSVSKNKKITLRQLLSHSAGLTVHGFMGYDRKAAIPALPQILDGKKPANSAPVRSEFEPGLRYQYSGGGTVISQLIMMDVTRQPYDKFMYDNVLKPMGMVNSFYTQPPPADKLKLVATGYNENGTEVKNRFHVYPEQAAAGLWMTPTDLCNYIIETQLAYEGKSSKVLTPEMTRYRLTPYNDKSVALGVFINETEGAKYFNHTAGNMGFCGMYIGSLEGGKGVVVFSNTENFSIIPEVVNSIATVYHWKDFYTPVLKKEVAVPDSILKKYYGIYCFDGHLSAVYKKEDGYYLLADGMSDKMHFSGERDFFNETFSSEKTFLVDLKGTVRGYMRYFDGKALPAAVKIDKPDTLKIDPAQINEMGRGLLEIKHFEDAISFLKRGIELDPKDMSAKLNLAHCYLFANNYGKAIELYKECRNKKVDQWSFADAINQDFVFFKNSGFETSLMDKVFADLKMEMPEDYK